MPRSVDHSVALYRMILPCLLLPLITTMSIPGPVAAVDGKWTPEQILQHDAEWLAELGLELPPDALWDDEQGGLLQAIVQLGGCSSGFVSDQGLVITNHHCAFGLLQEHSVGERNVVEEGFLAERLEDELPGATAVAIVPHRFTDVTAEIEAAVPDGADDAERIRAIDRRKKESVAECESQDFRRCQVAAYDDGLLYVLIEALEFRDVRLAYAPARAVGEYGGEIDNWMWPRHTGDFALLRVYGDADNQPADRAPGNRPYRPTRHLTLAQEPVQDGDFVMVVGYPGRTYRSLVAAEMAERAELFFPQRATLYRHWMDIMESSMEEDAEAGNLLSSRLKGLANREKNSRGQIKGIARGQLLQKKQQVEAELLQWAAEHPEHAAAAEAHRELSAGAEQWRQTTWSRDFLLEQTPRGPLHLAAALSLTRWAQERQKQDLERHEDYQERSRDRLLRRQQRDQKQLHLPTEQRLLNDLLKRFAALPEGQRVEALERRLGTDRSEAAIAALSQRLTQQSKVHHLEERLTMFEEDVDTLKSRQDALLDFAFDLGEEMLLLETQDDVRRGRAARLRPVWRRAQEAFFQRPVDPDANGTLRVSLAHVKGYSPRDGIFMQPFTRVSGIVEKHTGDEPFDAPQPVLQGSKQSTDSRWASAELGDVPVCFLADGDTTGGSSGSPVLNGRGELVGVNFDRVWENIANDFGYNPDIARNVSVDIRYLLWHLDEVERPASLPLLRELGVVE